MNEFSVACQESLEKAMVALQARPFDGEPKAGVLTGAFSVTFWDGISTRTEKGRVVYSVTARRITIWSVHPDHDEAYRRARARYKLKRVR